MTRLRIVRSNGVWFIYRGKDQAIPGFYPTLEEAREAAKGIKEPEVKKSESKKKKTY